MALLTPEHKATLAAELAKPEYSGLSPSDAASLLNAAPAVTEKRQVPRPFTRQQVLAVLSPTTLGGIMMLPIAPKIIDAINNGDHQALGEYAGAFYANQKMPLSEYQAVAAIVAATDDVVVAVGHEPTPFQALFGSTPFAIASGDGPLSISNTVSGTCLPEMVEEALS